MTTSPRFRPIAVAVIATLVTGTLLAVVAPSVANASTSSSISSLISKLNSYRAHHTSNAALKRNDFIDLNAEEYAKQYASDPSGDLDTFIPATALPLDTASTPSQPTGTEQSWTSISGSNAISRLASYFEAHQGSSISDIYNYIGVGIATKGSHTYAYMVLVLYTDPPQKRIAPGTATIAKSPRVGQDPGLKVKGFSPSGLTYSYVWESNGATWGGDLPDPTIQTPAWGTNLKVTVTVSRAGYADTSVTSNVSKPVQDGIPTAPKTLKVTGLRNVGQTLSAPGEDTEGWGPYYVNTYSYQWLRNGKVIVGATDSTYLLAAADYGKHIDLRMSLTGPDFTVATRQTHTSSKIGHPFLQVLASPLINGGDEPWGISRTPAYSIFPSGTKYALTWYAGGHKVGASFTFTPNASDAGKPLTVKVTGSMSGFTTTSVTSNGVNVLNKLFTAGGVAVITGGSGPGGVAEYGDKLGLTLTHPFSPTGTTYTYQWYVDTTPISGATHSTVKLPGTTPGLTVGVTITAHRTGYTPDAVSFNVAIN